MDRGIRLEDDYQSRAYRGEGEQKKGGDRLGES